MPTKSFKTFEMSRPGNSMFGDGRRDLARELHNDQASYAAAADRHMLACLLRVAFWLCVGVSPELISGSGLSIMAQIRTYFVTFCVMWWHGCQSRAVNQGNCVDEYGAAHDWWVAYKLPEISHHSDEGVRKGVRYVFVTSDSFASTEERDIEDYTHGSGEPEWGYPDTHWQVGKYDIDDPRSIFGQTLKPLYDKSKKEKSSIFYILYNDEHPDGNTSLARGHTKGVVLLRPMPSLMPNWSGVWLLHSVPKFPPVPADGYGYPHTGRKYGQTAMCTTVHGPRTIESIGHNFLLNDMYIYDAMIPNSFRNFSPTMTLVATGHVRFDPPLSLVQHVWSAAGNHFVIFAKSGKWHKELYTDLVAPTLGQNLFTETWQNGHGRLLSNCSEGHPRVQNLEDLSFDVANVKFSSHDDHSKWCISQNELQPWVCVSDINRMVTQTVRGGGCICFDNLNLWKLFRALFKASDVETCPQ
ncbi:unnamed protein product [Cyprideis torosa]|uniref:Uncharacterized protein n=1 Tax=Cyprideis torosa TaxID=163714 RepID=A0A7R8WJS0_9CRUS|nr:unnamed protein product [Cyprideis torosa]CAG0900521.1 unnamed protein product [Cyprideis torosa]